MSEPCRIFLFVLIREIRGYYLLRTTHHALHLMPRLPRPRNILCVLFVRLATADAIFLHRQGDPAIQIILILFAHHGHLIGAGEDVGVVAQENLALVVDEGVKLVDKGWVLCRPDGHVHAGNLLVVVAARIEIEETNHLPSLFKPFVAGGDVHKYRAALSGFENLAIQIHIGQALLLAAEAARIELGCTDFERFEHVEHGNFVGAVNVTGQDGVALLDVAHFFEPGVNGAVVFGAVQAADGPVEQALVEDGDKGRGREPMLPHRPCQRADFRQIPLDAHTSGGILQQIFIQIVAGITDLREGQRFWGAAITVMVNHHPHIDDVIQKRGVAIRHDLGAVGGEEGGLGRAGGRRDALIERFPFAYRQGRPEKLLPHLLLCQLDTAAQGFPIGGVQAEQLAGFV